MSRQQAKADGHKWIWIDTCCIDKTSSADLSEAINSMYKWYRESEVCYAFLNDVHDGPSEKQHNFPQMAKSKWFERGWTLQELVAPNKVEFLDSAWRVFARKEETLDTLVSITGISKVCLESPYPILYEPIAVRLSWASCRKTSRGEDLAYCLLGLLDVNMPLLYGEGPKSAFRRLMSEVVSSCADDSVFAHDLSNSSMIADSAQAFRHCGKIGDGCNTATLPPRSLLAVSDAAYAPRWHTKMGLQRPVAFIPMKDFYRVMTLDCHEKNPPAPVLILLQNISRGMRDMEHWTIQSSSSLEGRLVLEKASEKIRKAILENRNPFKVETMILR